MIPSQTRATGLHEASTALQAAHGCISKLAERTLGCSSLIASVLHAASSQYGTRPHVRIPIERRPQSAALFTQRRGVQFSRGKITLKSETDLPIGFDPCDCICDCITSICDYLCCCCCAPKSPGDEVKDGAVDGLIDATTF